MRVPIQVKLFSIWEFTMSVVKRTASFTFMQCGFLLCNADFCYAMRISAKREACGSHLDIV